MRWVEELPCLGGLNTDYNLVNWYSHPENTTQHSNGGVLGINQTSNDFLKHITRFDPPSLNLSLNPLRYEHQDDSTQHKTWESLYRFILVSFPENTFWHHDVQYSTLLYYARIEMQGCRKSGHPLVSGHNKTPSISKLSTSCPLSTLPSLSLVHSSSGLPTLGSYWSAVGRHCKVLLVEHLEVLQYHVSSCWELFQEFNW